MQGDSPAPSSTSSACLCVFDIDRTLTGKQGDTAGCAQNVQLHGVHDEGYGGGPATLSALSAAGIKSTPCDSCLLGITSAGAGSGEGSIWNTYILDHVMRGAAQDAFMAEYPAAKRYSYGTDVQSPFVLGQGNKVKQESVELVRRWYGARQVEISAANVFFFGDRTENIVPFASKGINSREISCGSRDPVLYAGSGMVGYCGARPEEITLTHGNILCEE